MINKGLKILSYIILQLLIWLSLSVTAGNAPITTAPDIIAIAGEQVSVPVTVENFNNIGAVSLVMHYDPSALTFLLFSNSSGFPNLFCSNPFAGKIVISGFESNAGGFTLPNGAVFFTLTFTFQGGNSGLAWYDDDGTSCEYTGPAPDFLPLNDIPTSTYYINGSVSMLYQSLSGVVRYHTYPGTGTPLSGMSVNLKNNQNVTLASAVTNAAGEYNFEEIPAGASRLEVVSPYPWGGVNATDALAIKKRTVGQPIPFWLPEAFLDKVADVNLSGGINSTDALAVMQRSIALITSFDAGDWAFYAQETNFTNTSANTAWMPYNGFYQINIIALCYGDLNRSYTPVLPEPIQKESSGNQQGEMIPAAESTLHPDIFNLISKNELTDQNINRTFISQRFESGHKASCLSREPLGNLPFSNETSNLYLISE